MQIVVTTQPAPLLTHTDNIVRQSLALDATDKDDLADMLLLAAQAELDGPLGWVGISVAQQSVEVVASSFDCPTIRLPGGPIVGDIVVTYLDGSGATQTLDAGTYVVGGDGSLTLVDGSSWPTVASQGDAVTVAYDVGIEDGNDPRISLMKAAIILHAKMTMHFEDVDTRRDALENLLRPLKVWTV